MSGIVIPLKGSPSDDELLCRACFEVFDLYRQAELAGKDDVAFSEIDEIALRLGAARVQLALTVSASMKLEEAVAIRAAVTGRATYNAIKAARHGAGFSEPALKWSDLVGGDDEVPL